GGLEDLRIARAAIAPRRLAAVVETLAAVAGTMGEVHGRVTAISERLHRIGRSDSSVHAVRTEVRRGLGFGHTPVFWHTRVGRGVRLARLRFDVVWMQRRRPQSTEVREEPATGTIERGDGP